MPRRARWICRGEYYHIVTRGNDRQVLFRREEDFEFYLKVCQHYKSKFKISLLHYCLMSNHVHALMRSDETNDGITKMMHGLQMVYARYYKKAYRKTGHVFEDRFKHYHIESEAYLLECGRYIERNPVRAGMVQDVGGYRWSSYGYYGDGRKNVLLNENPLYRGLGNSLEERREAYRNHVMMTRAYEGIVDKYFAERVLI